MSTLIIPCAGRKFINGKPQYLERHPKGMLLIERCLEGIFAGQYDRIVIVLLQEEVKKFNAQQIVSDVLTDRYSVTFVILSEPTNGPVETVYKAIQKLDLTGEIVVKDSDNFISLPIAYRGNFVAGLDLNEWGQDVHNLRDKSFLILNEQKNLLDIIEKKIRSDVICLGLYGFQKAEDFIYAYKKLNDGTYPIDRLYISYIISYLIGYSGKVFRYVSAVSYENWGDERLWKDIQRDYAMYFIDLDHIMGTSGGLSAEQEQKLTVLKERGASFVGYTTYNESYKDAILKTFEKAGLYFMKVIYGCPYSQVKEIIDTKEALQRKVIEL